MDSRLSNEEKIGLLKGIVAVARALGDSESVEDGHACIALLEKRSADQQWELSKDRPRMGGVERRCYERLSRLHDEVYAAGDQDEAEVLGQVLFLYQKHFGSI